MAGVVARDFQRGGAPVNARVSLPPPYLNEPGEAMAFIVEGEIDVDGSVSAADYADALIRIWDGADTGKPAGYFDVEWPNREVSV